MYAKFRLGSTMSCSRLGRKLRAPLTPAAAAAAAPPRARVTAEELATDLSMWPAADEPRKEAGCCCCESEGEVTEVEAP